MHIICMREHIENIRCVHSIAWRIPPSQSTSLYRYTRHWIWILGINQRGLEYFRIFILGLNIALDPSATPSPWRPSTDISKDPEFHSIWMNYQSLKRWKTISSGVGEIWWAYRITLNDNKFSIDSVGITIHPSWAMHEKCHNIRKVRLQASITFIQALSMVELPIILINWVTLG
jgi:hypothetical protein